MIKQKIFKLHAISALLSTMLLWCKMKHGVLIYLLWVAEKRANKKDTMHYMLRLLVCNNIIIKICEAKITTLEKLEAHK